MECCSISGARRALGHDLAVVHHHEPVAELLGLVHVVRGEHQRDAALLEPVQPVPQHVARLRVEPGGRLVEQQQVGFVDQRAGDASRAASCRPTAARPGSPARSVSWTNSSSSAARALALARGDVEVAAVDDQVLEHGQLGVELVRLRHDAEPRPDRAAVGRRVEAEDAQLAVGDRRRRSRSCASSRTCRRRSGRGTRTPRRAGTSTSMPSTAVNSPKRLTSPRAVISGVDPSFRPRSVRAGARRARRGGAPSPS